MTKTKTQTIIKHVWGIGDLSVAIVICAIIIGMMWKEWLMAGTPCISFLGGCC